MRCKPPRAHAGALATLDQMMRACFGGFTGLHFEAPAWGQGAALRTLAWLLVKCGACFCSFSGVFRKRLGFMFRGGWGVLARGCGRLCGCAGRFGGSQCLPPTCPNIVSGESDGLENLGAKAPFLPVWMTLRGPHTLVLPVPLPKQRCCQKPLLGDGRAFLGTIPSGKTHMEKTTFLAELRLRLGVADAPTDSWCPWCDGIMDMLPRHAGSCISGGERIQRHHAVRDVVFTWAARAGLYFEKERPSLLLPQHPDDMRSAHWGLADVYLPALAGFPAACDFAVTAQAARDPCSCKESDRRSCRHLCSSQGKPLTAALCASQGVGCLCPDGGWSHGALENWCRSNAPTHRCGGGRTKRWPCRRCFFNAAARALCGYQVLPGARCAPEAHWSSCGVDAQIVWVSLLPCAALPFSRPLISATRRIQFLAFCHAVGDFRLFRQHLRQPSLRFASESLPPLLWFSFSSLWVVWRTCCLQWAVCFFLPTFSVSVLWTET